MLRVHCCLFPVALLVTATISLAGQPPAELVWEDRFDLGGHRDNLRQVVVSRGLLVTDGLSFFELEPGEQRRERITHLSAYSLESGELAWRQQVSGNGGRQLFAAKGNVILVGSAGFGLRIWAFDLESGLALWQAEGPPFESEAAVSRLADGVLYTAGVWRPAAEPEFALLIQARDPRSGTLLWEHRGAAGAFVHVPSLAVQDGLLVVTSVQRPGQDVGVIEAFDAVTGVPLWQRTEDNTTLGLLNASTAGCRGRVFLSGTRADKPFGQAETLVIRALSARTGETIWENAFEGPAKTTYSPRGLLCAGPSVYAVGASGSQNDDQDDTLSLWAFAGRSGAERWRQDFAGDKISGRLLELEKRTLFLRVEDRLLSYTRSSGRLRWETNPLGEGFWVDVDLAHNGYLAVVAVVADDQTKTDAVVRVLR